MGKGTGKLPHKPGLPNSGVQRANKSARDPMTERHWGADKLAKGVSRVRRASAWLPAILLAVLAVPAAAQNLDAGKPPAQIFSEVCSTCHRSTRDFKNGASASFLREHYTTSSDMASSMAAYLAGARADPRAGAAPGTRPGSGTAAAATGRDAPADPARDVRRPPAPVDAKSADARPGDAKSSDAKSSDAKAGDGKPADPRSVASVPNSFARRSGSARAEATTKPGASLDAKSPAAAAPPPPPLQEFEE
jgi:hypothetical protein